MFYEDDAKARANLRRINAWGLLHFKKNYTDSLISKMTHPQKMDEKLILDGFVDTRIDSSSDIFLFISFYLYHNLLIPWALIISTTEFLMPILAG